MDVSFKHYMPAEVLEQIRKNFGLDQPVVRVLGPEHRRRLVHDHHAQLLRPRQRQLVAAERRAPLAAQEHERHDRCPHEHEGHDEDQDAPAPAALAPRTATPAPLVLLDGGGGAAGALCVADPRRRPVATTAGISGAMPPRSIAWPA